MSLFKSVLNAALLMTQFVMCATAQSASLKISGVIFDPSGALVADAVVELQKAPGYTLQTVQSDLRGRFQFSAPSPGSYSVVVRQHGFKDAVMPVRLQTKPLSAMTITLELAQVYSEISVGLDAVQVSGDAAENRDAPVVGQNLLEQLPVLGQDYLATLKAFLDPGAIASGTSLVVDGMEANTAGVTSSAIKEIRINQNPYSAEFFRPGRGRIEIITKEAGSDYHGALNFIFRDSHLNARDPFALVRAPEQRRIFEGSLSGPVKHSKTLSFLLSGSRQDDDLQAVIYARDLSGPVQKTVPSPRGLMQLAFRITRQFSSSHTMSWQYNDRTYPGKNLGIGGFVLPEAGTNPDHWEREIVFTDRKVLSTHWVNQFQILLGREHEGMRSISSAPGIVVHGAFTGGGAQVNILRTENHFQASDIATLSSGRHVLKLGMNVPDWSRRGVNNYNNFGGTYYFSSLEDYARERPYAYQLQQGSGHAVYLQKELGGFVQDDIKVSPSFSFALGLRYDWQNFLHDENNFSPRMAFAYAPGRTKKTVLRGGSGFFYDRTGYLPLADLVLYDGRILRSYLIADPSYPNPLSNIGSIAAQPSQRVQLDPAVRQPYSLQYSLTVEHQLAKRTILSATYRGSRGIKLYRSRDVNAPLAPDYLVRPNRDIGVLRQIESSGRQSSEALEAALQGEVTRRFTGIVQYTWSRTYNNTGGIAWFPANQYDPRGEWSRADSDQRHRFNVLGSVTLGKGMTLGAGVTLNSGAPYTMITGTDPFRTGLANARPDGVPRNSLQGPGYANVDLRWARDFYWDKMKKDTGTVVTSAFDAFNVFNHVNYGAYVGNLSSPFFGQPVSALPARRLQFTARVKF